MRHVGDLGNVHTDRFGHTKIRVNDRQVIIIAIIIIVIIIIIIMIIIINIIFITYLATPRKESIIDR